MKTNDFSKYLSGFFTEYLSSERGVSHNTIRSYSETFAAFLDYMGSMQHVAAIHAFAKYMQYEDVAHLEQWQSILSIKIKKTVKRSVNFLSTEGIKALLEQIPQETRTGRQDLAMIALLYGSGARVQELVDLTSEDLHLDNPCYVTLFGKGRKKGSMPKPGCFCILCHSERSEESADGLCVFYSSLIHSTLCKSSYEHLHRRICATRY